MIALYPFIGPIVAAPFFALAFIVSTIPVIGPYLAAIPWLIAF
jgi:hypothetical protein